MFILQPFKERVKPRTEGSVNYKRSAWLGHRGAPWEKREAWLWERACTLLCPCHHDRWADAALPGPASLILVPLGQGSKGWLFLTEEPLHIPTMDYWWALSGKCSLLSFGGKNKSGPCCLLGYVVCLVVKQNGFHSLEMHRAYLKCERQKEAEYLCSSNDFKLFMPNHYWSST